MQRRAPKIPLNKSLLSIKSRELMGNINHKDLKPTDNYVVAMLGFEPNKVRIECYTQVKPTIKKNQGRGCAISYIGMHEKGPVLKQFEQAGYKVYDKTSHSVRGKRRLKVEA